jgi:hypothetical protein
MKERRRDTRAQEENRVVIETTGPSNGKNGDSVNAFTRDLSLGGARIETDQSFPIGTELKMTLYLSKSWQVVKLQGRVQWVKDVEQGLFEIGIQFMHEIPSSIMSLITHLFRKPTNIPTSIRS